MKYVGNTTTNKVTQNNITTIYPNLTNSSLNIEVTETLKIKIVNMFGAIVYTNKLNTCNNAIDVSTLTKSIYLIQSHNGGSLKFVKE